MTIDNHSSNTGKARTGRGRLSLIFAVLAFIACNGAILLIGVFSAIGISVSINPHLQAAAISLFAIVTLALVFRDFKRHRVVGPLLLAAVACITLVGTMYIHFDKVIESIGLLALFTAALWGWQVNRRHCGVQSSLVDD
ncbi:MAG: MerC domain-containing protein [Gammaproteobacteria bacterium]|nr:MerC domain-containing protein [Gammaproteobacteria bacterium]